MGFFFVVEDGVTAALLLLLIAAVFVVVLHGLLLMLLLLLLALIAVDAPPLEATAGAIMGFFFLLTGPLAYGLMIPFILLPATDCNTCTGRAVAGGLYYVTMMREYLYNVASSTVERAID